MNLANLEMRLVHSSCMPTLIKSPVPLLVVSDNHGEVDYQVGAKESLP